MVPIPTCAFTIVAKNKKNVQVICVLNLIVKSDIVFFGLVSFLLKKQQKHNHF